MVDVNDSFSFCFCATAAARVQLLGTENRSPSQLQDDLSLYTGGISAAPSFHAQPRDWGKAMTGVCATVGGAGSAGCFGFWCSLCVLDLRAIAIVAIPS